MVTFRFEKQGQRFNQSRIENRDQHYSNRKEIVVGVVDAVTRFFKEALMVARGN